MTVIDGQQRLTTITIIFKALQSYAKEKLMKIVNIKKSGPT